jgi:hypothetical protein
MSVRPIGLEEAMASSILATGGTGTLGGNMTERN